MCLLTVTTIITPRLPPPSPSRASLPSPSPPKQTPTATIIWACYLSDTNRGLLLSFRPYGHPHDPRHPAENYPQGYIEQLHHGETNSRAVFSPSFVDNMRIPRAMEVKIIESVNSLNNSHPHPPYSPPCQSPIRLSQDLLSADMFSFPKERMAPSRQQSFRYSNMSTEESNERMYREKMLVSELREKLRNQHQINEWKNQGGRINIMVNSSPLGQTSFNSQMTEMIPLKLKPGECK